jgi:hypothetical protein
MHTGLSAKAGQFGKQEIFGAGISSPYQEGGPVKSGIDATYGYKSTGSCLFSYSRKFACMGGGKGSLADHASVYRLAWMGGRGVLQTLQVQVSVC